MGYSLRGQLADQQPCSMIRAAGVCNTAFRGIQEVLLLPACAAACRWRNRLPSTGQHDSGQLDRGHHDSFGICILMLCPVLRPGLTVRMCTNLGYHWGLRRRSQTGIVVSSSSITCARPHTNRRSPFSATCTCQVTQSLRPSHCRLQRQRFKGYKAAK